MDSSPSVHTATSVPKSPLTPWRWSVFDTGGTKRATKRRPKKTPARKRDQYDISQAELGKSTTVFTKKKTIKKSFADILSKWMG